jgi:predicted nucleic acid-binding Zn ribbon protein
MNEEPLSESMYLRLKTLWTGSPATRKKRRGTSTPRGSEPFSAGRDPISVSAAMQDVSTGLGWDTVLAEATLVSDWPNVVGPDTAANTDVDRLEAGVLVVRCSSTAWATQLTFISSEILTRLMAAHPNAALTKISFIGPNAPSWKRGPRAIQGRGVRDTYG